MLYPYCKVLHMIIIVHYILFMFFRPQQHGFNNIMSDVAHINNLQREADAEIGDEWQSLDINFQISSVLPSSATPFSTQRQAEAEIGDEWEGVSYHDFELPPSSAPNFRMPHAVADGLMSVVRSSIECSICTETFNKGILCQDYLIQLNKPVQYMCGCQICTHCYRENLCCSPHKMYGSTFPQMKNIASDLANCLEFENSGSFNLEDMKHDDRPLKNAYVRTQLQDIMNGRQVIDIPTLQPGRL